MKNRIPVHNDELHPSGIEILSFSGLAESPKIPHRDDHYMFMIQQKGTASWTIDFRKWTLEQTAFCFVAPGQVHQYLQNKHAEGWLVFVDPKLVPGEYRMMLDNFMYHRQVVSISSDHPAFMLIHVLNGFITQDPRAIYASVLHSCVAALAGMLTVSFVPQHRHDVQAGSHKYNLVMAFKEQIRQQFKITKQVKEYAAQLNITPLYLNEVSNELTGFAASYWIRKEILLEAQRLLFYTDMDVKEIAFTLGYEDHTYFSRFFKKNIGTTAITFRKNNHYLSNHNH